MAKFKLKEAGAEVECPSCGGTGFPKTKQPAQPVAKSSPPAVRNALARVDWLSRPNDHDQSRTNRSIIENALKLYRSAERTAHTWKRRH